MASFRINAVFVTLVLLSWHCRLSLSDLREDLEANIISDSLEEVNVPKRRDCTFEDASDLYIKIPDLIRKNGFPSEVHHITTADGYILELHRIPGAIGSPPVILHHGMLMTSRAWFLNCDGRALPFKLASTGNDVWLVNVRGNMYSNGHVNLTMSDRKYWSYTVDELIKYDVPATIDYVLEVSGSEKVNWIGWSLGTAVILGLTSSRPEYNEKINLFFTMGTVAYVGKTKSAIFRMFGMINKLYDRALTTLTRGAFIPSAFFPIIHHVMPSICIPEARWKFVGICSSMLFMLDGYSPEQLNFAYLPFVFATYPSTGAVRMVMHWFQWISTGQFRMFDYGRRVNMAKYGQAIPPAYDLSKVTVKVVNFWSDNDYISTPQDVQRTIRSLKNVQYNIHINMTDFNHLDFGLGRDTDLYVYNDVVKILDEDRRKK